MIKLCVAFIDGTFVEYDFPNHEVETIELMIEGTPKSLLSRVELENNKHIIIYSYKRETDYAY